MGFGKRNVKLNQRPKSTNLILKSGPLIKHRQAAFKSHRGESASDGNEPVKKISQVSGFELGPDPE